MTVTRVIAALCLVCWGTAVFAGSARMQLEVEPGLVAEADYWPGAADRRQRRLTVRPSLSPHGDRHQQTKGPPNGEPFVNRQVVR